MPVAHEAIDIDGKYVHEKTGNLYQVIRIDNIEVKDSSSNNWHPAVMYRSLSEDRMDMHYIRSIQDFGAKFSPYVPQEEEPEEAE